MLSVEQSSATSVASSAVSAASGSGSTSTMTATSTTLIGKFFASVWDGRESGILKE